MLLTHRKPKGKLSVASILRKRTLQSFVGRGTILTVLGNKYTFSTYLDYAIVSKQITTSFENVLWILQQRLKRNPRYRRLPARHRNLEHRDAGSAFTTERQRHSSSHRNVVLDDLGTGTRRVYTGPLFALRAVNTGATSGFPSLGAGVSEFEMITRGTKFIKETIPTNPVAGLSTILGELREGLPQLPARAFSRPQNRTALGALRQSGSEYVNVQFGILPLVKDVQDVAKAVRTSDKVVQQYIRDSGRHIRRKAELPETTTTEIEVLAGDRTISPALPLSFFESGGSSGPLTRTRVTKTKWSFSACYTYYLDPGVTALGRLNRQVQVANKLLGVRITPAVLWELTPWSWAADYVGNIGDVLTNVSALMSDSLVIRWAYVMVEESITDTYVQSSVRLKSGAGAPFVQTFATVRKSRRQATPYGFGLDPDAFTPRQWAIIGALGISKGPRQL